MKRIISKLFQFETKVVYTIILVSTIVAFQNCSNKSLDITPISNSNSSTSSIGSNSLITLDQAGYNIIEGTSGTIVISLVAPTATIYNINWSIQTTSINLITVDDWQTISGTVSIPVGQKSVNLILSAKPNTTVSPDKNYQLKVQAQGNYNPVMANLVIKDDNVAQIIAGDQHACVLKSKSLSCWGYNGYGQLGNGNGTTSATPVQVTGMTSGVQKASLGTNDSCAIKNGALYCWGYNGYGQLGKGTTDGQVNSAPQLVPGMDANVTDLAVGHYTNCAIKNGSLYCWGYNGYGQLGDGTEVSKYVPTQVVGLTSGVSAVSSSSDNDDDGSGILGHTCAIQNGALYCWGYNSYGQLGDGTNNRHDAPMIVSGMESGVVSVSVAAYHTCALKNNGAVYCWGFGLNGELGDGVSLTRYAPWKVAGGLTGKNVVKISIGKYTSCASTDVGALYCWGYNEYGEVGIGNTVNQSLPALLVGFETGVSSFSESSYSTYAILNNKLYSWGYNGNGQLGNGQVIGGVTVTAPVQVMSF